MKRILLLLSLMLAFALAWNRLGVINIKAVGQPSMTGPIQRNMEQPFFESLAKTTGLPFKVDYRSMDTLGFKDNRQLSLMKDGLADMVSLRFLQNSEEEPAILGIDPPGLNTNFQTARKIAHAYSPALDANLQSRFGVKLLGIWPFGPQVFWCRRPIHQLADIKGLKVRIGSTLLSPLIASQGGIPVVIPFDEVVNALSLNIADCAVTSLISGYADQWAEHVTHIYPIATQLGLNGIAIRLKIWDTLSSDQQQRLTKAVDAYIASVWDYAEKLNLQASDCLQGKETCVLGTRYKLRISPVTPQDIEFMHDFAHRTSFPIWATRCDQISPGCSAQWEKIVEPILHPAHQP